MTPFNLMQIGSIGLLLAISAISWSGYYDLRPGTWIVIGWLGAMMPLTLGYILTRN